MSRRIVFESSAFADFTEWAKLDKKIYRKILEILKSQLYPDTPYRNFPILRINMIVLDTNVVSELMKPQGSSIATQYTK